MTLKHCTTCNDAAYLTVEVQTTTTRKNKTDTSTDSLVHNATLRSDQSKAFLDRLAAINAAAAAAAPPAATG